MVSMTGHLWLSVSGPNVYSQVSSGPELAIAHNVVDLMDSSRSARTPSRKGPDQAQWQPRELTDDELDALIQAKIREKKAWFF